jgi:hypothetical protein
MRSLAALCLVALGVAGCGAAPRDSAQDFKGEQRAVAAVVERLEAAGRDDKPDVVCTQLLSTKLLAAVRAQGTNCKTGVGESFKDADSFDITVKDVVIRGTHATATTRYRRGSDDETATLELEREGASWKISGGILGT